jgi:beta-phosphoglucomutase-like phosphatase (HAD superfamily)
MFEQQIKQYLIQHSFGSFSPKAVLFDMDGVLYDSMPNHVVAWQESMKKFGITMTADDAYATEGARGIDTIQRFVKLQQDRDISLDEAQLMYDEKSRIFHSMKEAPVFEGVTDLMRKIKAAGMQIAIVTGSGQRPLITRLINDFYEFVDEAHVVTAYDVERGKPYPDPYLMGLDKCGHLKPWEGIVVENAPLGVKAGAEAQCFTVAVNSGPLPDNTLLAQGANVLFHRITELRNHWEQLVSEAGKTAG